ncbi:MAG: hypothetical protein AB7L41_11115 [Flavobacteriaceae bacterium]
MTRTMKPRTALVTIFIAAVMSAAVLQAGRSAWLGGSDAPMQMSQIENAVRG